MVRDDSLILTLSGHMTLTDGHERPIEGISRRGQGLLAYLSQQTNMRAERGLIADLLWSDRSEQQARASLRQEISVLKRALPEGCLNSNRQAVWLDTAAVQIKKDGSEEFLLGFDLPSEGFEDWLRTVRMPADQPREADADTSQIFTRPAVLLFAFETLSNGPDDQLIAAGLVDDLRTTLCYWRWFPVIGPEAIGWRTAKDGDLRDIAAEVEAAYAVTGSIRCLGNRVRISVNLIDTENGRVRWSQQFDGTFDDIFSFQEEVSRAIVGQLEPQIAQAEATRIARMRPSSIGPWQLLAQADEINRKGGEGYGTPESNLEQRRLLEKAIEIDPDLSTAYARIGRVQFRFGLLGWTKDIDGVLMDSLANCEKALALDPDNWEGHAYAGLVNVFGFQKYQASLLNVNEAVRLNPSAAVAQHACGCAKQWLGQLDEALVHQDLVFRLNPTYPGRAAIFGENTSVHLFLGNRDASLASAERLFSIAPGYARGLQRCLATFGYFDQMDRATQTLKMLREIQPDFDEAYVRKTYPYANPDHTELMIDGMRKAGAFVR